MTKQEIKDDWACRYRKLISGRMMLLTLIFKQQHALRNSIAIYQGPLKNVTDFFNYY